MDEKWEFDAPKWSKFGGENEDYDDHEDDHEDDLDESWFEKDHPVHEIDPNTITSNKKRAGSRSFLLGGRTSSTGSSSSPLRVKVAANVLLDARDTDLNAPDLVVSPAITTVTNISSAIEETERPDASSKGVAKRRVIALSNSASASASSINLTSSSSVTAATSNRGSVSVRSFSSSSSSTRSSTSGKRKIPKTIAPTIRNCRDRKSLTGRRQRVVRSASRTKS